MNGKEFKLTGIGPFTFSIGDTSSFSQYVKGGIVTEVKKPKVVSFVSFLSSLSLKLLLSYGRYVHALWGRGHVPMMTSLS